MRWRSPWRRQDARSALIRLAIAVAIFGIAAVAITLLDR